MAFLTISPNKIKKRVSSYIPSIPKGIDKNVKIDSVVNNGLLSSTYLVSLSYVFEYNSQLFCAVAFRNGQYAVANLSTQAKYEGDLRSINANIRIAKACIKSGNKLLISSYEGVAAQVINLDDLSVIASFSDPDSFYPSGVGGAGVQELGLGSNGNIYMGTTNYAKLIEYDIASNTFTDHGGFGDNPPIIDLVSNRYSYYCTGNPQYKYSINRRSGNYYLGVLEVAGGLVVDYYNDKYKSGRITVKDDAGTIRFFASLKSSDSGSPNLALELSSTGTITWDNASYGALPEVTDRELYGDMSYSTTQPENFPGLYNIVFDADSLLLDRKIRWQDISTSIWTEILLTDTESISNGANFISTYNNNLIASTNSYGPLITSYSPSTADTVRNAMPNISVDGIINTEGSKYYIYGYPNKVYFWDASVSWNLGQYIHTDPLSNPKLTPLTTSNAFYNYFAAFHPGYRTLYVSYELARNDTGSGIHAINVDTDEITLMTNSSLFDFLLTRYQYGFTIVEDRIYSFVYDINEVEKNQLLILDISSGFDFNSSRISRINLPWTSKSISYVEWNGRLVVINEDKLIIINGDKIEKTKTLPVEIYQTTNYKNSLIVTGNKIMFPAENFPEAGIYEYDLLLDTIEKISPDYNLVTRSRKLFKIDNNRIAAFGGGGSYTDYLSTNDSDFVEIINLTSLLTDYSTNTAIFTFGFNDDMKIDVVNSNFMFVYQNGDDISVTYQGNVIANFETIALVGNTLQLGNMYNSNEDFTSYSSGELRIDVI